MTDNLFHAMGLVARIDKLRAVQRELKSGFVRDELDGGAKAALTHPLYVDATDTIQALQDELKLLI